LKTTKKIHSFNKDTVIFSHVGIIEFGYLVLANLQSISMNVFLIFSRVHHYCKTIGNCLKNMFTIFPLWQ
jgi:hypothetical protein